MTMESISTEGPRARPVPMTRRLGDSLVVPIGVLAIAAAAVILWLVASGPFSYFVAPPWQSVQSLYGGFATGWIVPGGLATLQVVLLGFLIAFFGGSALGLFIGLNRFWREVVEPLLVVVYVLPKIVLLPLFILIFGLGMKSLIGLAAVSALFPILINVATGIREMNPVYYKVGKSYNARLSQMILKVYLPAIALPLITGVRLGFSVCFVITVIGEMVGSDQGLGLELFRAYSVLDIPKMYGLMLLLFAAAFVLNMAPWFVEKRLRRQMG